MLIVPSFLSSVLPSLAVRLVELACRCLKWEKMTVRAHDEKVTPPSPSFVRFHTYQRPSIRRVRFNANRLLLFNLTHDKATFRFRARGLVSQ